MPFKNKVDLLTGTSELVADWDVVSDVLVSANPVGVGSSTELGTDIVPLIVRKYESLIIRVKTDRDVSTGTPPIVGERHAVAINWLGDDNFFNTDLGSVEYDNNFPTVLGARWMIPVRGPRCIIEYKNKSIVNAVNIQRFQVFGSTVRRRDRVEWLHNQSAHQYNVFPQPTGIGRWERPGFLFADGPIYLNGIGNNLTVTVFISGAVTVAGTMRIRAVHDPTVVYGQVAIPATAFTLTTLSVVIPIGQPVEIMFPTVPTTAAAVSVAATWDDYEEAV
jgi:hypothetical protein